MTYALTNVGNVPIQLTEYTSGPVLNNYSSNIYTILSQLTLPDANNPNDPTNGYSTVLTAVQVLENMAKNGLYDPTSGSVFYMTEGMLNNVNFAINLLQTCGISTTVPINSAAEQSATMSVLRGGANNSQVISILTDAYSNPSITSSAITLQSLIELEWVKAGNNMIANQLSSLEGTLNLTNDILTNLHQLQNIATHVTLASVVPQTLIADAAANTTQLSVFLKNYKVAANAYFAARLPLPALQAGDGRVLYNIYHSLSAQIGVINSINNGADGSNVQNSLGYFLNQAKQQLSSVFSPSFLGTNPADIYLDQSAKGWILFATNPGGVTKNVFIYPPGIIQNSITSAINSAQTMNNQQQLEVQKYEFFFQQYFQSASTALQTTTNIIGTMTQNISRG